MNRLFSCFLIGLMFISAHSYAGTVIWSGAVYSNGAPTAPIKLVLGRNYQIKVSGTLNLGKWWQKGLPLLEDACYEFNEQVSPSPLVSIKNSINISICTGKYNSDHVYLSTPFIAVQNSVHFWIYDTDYSDNEGALQVEIIELNNN